MTTTAEELAAWQADQAAKAAALPNPCSVAVARQALIAQATVNDDLTGCLPRTTTTVQRGLKMEWTRPDTRVTGRAKGMVLYVHGAAQTGSAQSYRPIAAQLARKTPTSVAVLDYRRPPETHFPLPYFDVLTVLDYLDTHSHPVKNLVMAGDSFGGMPLLAAVIARRNAGKTLPRGLYLLCPDCDYTNRARLQTMPADPNPNTCPVNEALNQYFDDPQYPCTGMTASPALDDLTGLPPILMHESRLKPLKHALALRDRLDALYDSNRFIFRDWPDVPHIFPTYRTGWFPTYGTEALSHAAGWIRARLL